MVSPTKIQMTLEQASALRVIIKFEFVGKTGDVFRDMAGKDVTFLLNTVVKNAELWSRIDHAIATPMVAMYRGTRLDISIQDDIEVEFEPGMIDTIQAILHNGVYQKTISTANSSKEMQTTIGSMIPVAIVERNLEAIKRIFSMEENPMTFFPMKAAEGKQ